MESNECALPDAVSLQEVLGRMEAHLIMFIHSLAVHEEFYMFKLKSGNVMQSKLFLTETRVDSDGNQILVCQKCLHPQKSAIVASKKKIDVQKISLQARLMQAIYTRLTRYPSSKLPIDTQSVRQIYYLSRSHSIKQRPSDAYNNTLNSINELCRFFSSSRHLLGIVGEPQGRVCGGLFDRESLTTQITPSLVEYVASLLHTEQPQLPQLGHILIIEKQGIFEILIKHNIFDWLLPNTTLICSNGFPDLLTRKLVKSLQVLSTVQFLKHRSILDLNQRAPALVLTDLNPGGASIMFTFKYGSRSMFHESNELKAHIGWLGMHCKNVKQWHISENYWQDYTKQDYKILNSLFSHPLLEAPLKTQLNIMQEFCKKVELQSVLHEGGGDRFCRLVAQSVLAKQWI